jgi:ATP-binding cassette subfamily B protein
MPRPAGGLSSLRLMLPFLRPYRLRLVVAALAMLAAAGLTLGLGQGLRHLIDSGFASGGTDALDSAALGMFAVVAALAAATALRFFMITSLGERLAADIRRAVFDHLLALSPVFFETARTGDILSRLSADIGVLQALVGTAISQGLRSMLMAAGAFALLVHTSPKLAGLVAVVVPLVVAPLILFGRKEKALSRLAQERIADLGARAEEVINGIRTVQAFTHEARERARFAQQSNASVAAALRRIRTRAAQILVVILLGVGAITFSLWVGGRDVVAGRMTGGELSAFVFYAVVLASSGTTISELWGEVQRAAGAAERLLELLSVPPAIARPQHPAPLPRPARGRIVFEDVGFTYPTRPDRPALDGFSLIVEPGETVALVGPSGAGKTTVLQLLLRFYDPTRGRILVDGVNIAQADPAELRARIGLVPQDPVIFSTDAGTNIAYGRPDATASEIRAAAEAAAALGFIETLPQGLATHLGAKGMTLSGGQRQRVAIARAILRDPAILLLDEATSALDAESEQAVQQALARLSWGRTTLVVAHRLATVRRADRIVVLEGGRVAATGPHEALIREGGLYARLASLQFGETR